MTIEDLGVFEPLITQYFSIKKRKENCFNILIYTDKRSNYSTKTKNDIVGRLETTPQ